MGYSARVLADSISNRNHRLTTIEVTFPRIVLAEFNTHRVFSRNSASSRAIPVIKQLKRVLEEPFVPDKFGKNQRGMQSYDFHAGESHEEARRLWLLARDRAAFSAIQLLIGVGKASKIYGSGTPSCRDLLSGLDDVDFQLETALDSTLVPVLNVHKQITNRLLEPFMWHTVIVSSTEWSNYLALRVDENAQREIFLIAELMQNALGLSNPQLLDEHMWHLPLIQWQESEEAVLAHDEEGIQRLKEVSAGRCARVSYLTHFGRRSLEADVDLYRSLSHNGHMSPLEHVARPMTREELKESEWSGNFRGWHQFRKDHPHEDDFSEIKAQRAEEESRA